MAPFLLTHFTTLFFHIYLRSINLILNMQSAHYPKIRREAEGGDLKKFDMVAKAIKYTS
jgi:hypothetical protein